jgi:uncharacterized protein
VSLPAAKDNTMTTQTNPRNKTSPATAGSTASSGAPIALITGASSGIGEALTVCFAKAGYELILVARSVDKLQDLSERLAAEHGALGHVMAADLAVPGAASQLASAVALKKLEVDVLVNCAGVLHQGPFSGMAGSIHQQMIDLNISGVTAMLSAFLPAMTQRAATVKTVRILNVASIAAYQPIPMLATYAATKAYVLSLGESLAEELKASGITVTTLCPGMTATAMLGSMAGTNSKTSQIPSFMVAKAETVAQDAFNACMRGDVICVPGVVNQAMAIGLRIAPKWMVRKLGGLMGRKAL